MKGPATGAAASPPTRHRPDPTSSLTPAARAFRGAHAGVAGAFLLAIAHVWLCALTGRRDRLLRVSLGALAAEGLLVTANRGDCPLGGLQERMGDPVPLFELVLSPTAAHRAVPALGAVTVAGMALLAWGSAGRGSARRRVAGFFDRALLAR